MHLGRKIKVWLALDENLSCAASGNPVTYGHVPDADQTKD